MKFFQHNSDRLVEIKISKYLINWQRKVSGPQKKVKDFLFLYWKNSIVLEEFRIPGSLLRIDLMNLSKKIIIEVSPRALHVDFNKFMHGGRGGYLQKLKSDAEKLVWAEKSGFTFIELFDEEINNLSIEMFKKNFDIDL